MSDDSMSDEQHPERARCDSTCRYEQRRALMEKEKSYAEQAQTSRRSFSTRMVRNLRRSSLPRGGTSVEITADDPAGNRQKQSPTKKVTIVTPANIGLPEYSRKIEGRKASADPNKELLESYVWPYRNRIGAPLATHVLDSNHPFS